MNVQHDTDDLLRGYFRQRIDSGPIPASGRETGRPRTRGEIALWVARVAAAAVFAAALLTPFAERARLTPGEPTFTEAHQRLDTSGHVTRGLLAARDVLRIHFQGESR